MGHKKLIELKCGNKANKQKHEHEGEDEYILGEGESSHFPLTHTSYVLNSSKENTNVHSSFLSTENWGSWCFVLFASTILSPLLYLKNQSTAYIFFQLDAFIKVLYMFFLTSAAHILKLQQHNKILTILFKLLSSTCILSPPPLPKSQSAHSSLCFIECFSTSLMSMRTRSKDLYILYFYGSH